MTPKNLDQREIEHLQFLYREEIVPRVDDFGEENQEIKDLLSDYFGNEHAAFSWGGVGAYPKSRWDEFERMAQFLISRKKRDVLRILSDYNSWEMLSTNDKRDYLLWKIPL